MKNLLTHGNADALREAMSQKPLLVFDFDGTLAPIAEGPNDAQMKSSTRALLDSLSRAVPCCILSGRALKDVRSRVQGIPLYLIVGNHGSEWTEDLDGTVRKQIQEWHEFLLGAVKSPGIIIENKGHSLSLHVRSDEAEQEAEGILSRLPNARVVGGKRVYNIVPHDSLHKGDALKKLLADSERPLSIYTGDDETDEDVFGLTGTIPLLGVRVGRSPQSRAEYYIEDQDSIDSMLALMLRNV